MTNKLYNYLNVDPKGCLIKQDVGMLCEFMDSFEDTIAQFIER